MLDLPLKVYAAEVKGKQHRPDRSSGMKASPPKQICDSEMVAFLDRVTDLAPVIAVFYRY
jgi:hypothetical protein